MLDSLPSISARGRKKLNKLKESTPPLPPLAKRGGNWKEAVKRAKEKRRLDRAAASLIRDGYLRPPGPPDPESEFYRPDPGPSSAPDFVSGQAVQLENPGALWSEALKTLKAEIDGESFETWFAPIARVECEGELVLSVPSVFFRNWVISNYQNIMLQKMESVAGHAVAIRYVIRPDAEAMEA